LVLGPGTHYCRLADCKLAVAVAVDQRIVDDCRSSQRLLESSAEGLGGGLPPGS